MGAVEVWVGIATGCFDIVGVMSRVSIRVMVRPSGQGRAQEGWGASPSRISRAKA